MADYEGTIVEPLPLVATVAFERAIYLPRQAPGVALTLGGQGAPERRTGQLWPRQ